MLIILCSYLCVFIGLVTANVQYHRVTCPYNHLNYGNVYGSAPLVMHPPSPYTQQYILQNVPNYQPRNSITDLQQMYLSQVLSNPAIQAFIDPNTKIYNQNGVDISDQILPRTPNVVNNYFIVPTEYLNQNVKKKIKTNDNNKPYISNAHEARDLKPKSLTETTDYRKPTSDYNIDNERYKNNEHKSRTSDRHSKKRKKNSSSNKEQSEGLSNSQRSAKKKIENLSNKNVVFDDQMYVDKAKTNIKRQDKAKDTSNTVLARTESITNSKTNDLKQNIKSVEAKSKESKVVRKDNNGKDASTNVNKCKSTMTLDKDLFDITKECVNLDNRNIRNPVDNNQNNEQSRQSSRNQDNFMKQWMAYIKSFTPQNFESYDFSNFNLPYNIDQMYQLPKTSSSDSNAAPKTRRRKQQRKNKQQSQSSSNRSTNNGAKKTTIEIVPKHDIGSQSVLTEIKENIESNLDTPITKSLEATHYIVDVSTENTQPIIYDITDYYPDFTQDEVYSSDENEPYYFHNRHFYEPNDEEPIMLEGRKYEGKRDSSKQPDKSKRGNDIPTLDTDFKDHRKPVFEELKFQTPPTLTDPGFQTKKINVQDINHDTKPYNDKHNQTPKRNVETVFARSKVVKYGQNDEVIEKPKVIEEPQRNDRERKHNPKDGDTTVVFAQSWK